MEILYFIGGVVLSTIVYIVIYIRTNRKTYGIIDIDHKHELCGARVTSSDLYNRNLQKATFKVNHNANLSREEQLL